MTLRFNPFRPGGIITPGMFSGRIEELDLIERCLFQAKNGNPVHFMVQGERGIGKSSLFYYSSLQAAGQVKGIHHTEHMNFLVVSCDLGGAKTQIDIIRAIASELKSVISRNQVLREKAKAVWDWITKWEVLGVRYHKAHPDDDPTDIATTLINQVADLCENAGDTIDGVLILIDEADQPDVEANLGLLCKTLTERLMRRSCDRVVLGLAGLPQLLNKLRGSHESSPRIFTSMVLEPLSTSERSYVIRQGLKDAYDKNKIETKINDDALTLICHLSEGYPHFIQQFSYSSFDADRDDIIDVADVTRGAFGENGALSQLGQKYFSEMYNSRIASDNYRTVLNTMSSYGDQWVSRKDIIIQSKLPKTIVTNALNALKARNIIASDESRKGQGFYRLPTRSFAAWIGAYQSVNASPETHSNRDS